MITSPARTDATLDFR